MLMEKERAELVKYGRKLVEAGLTKGTGGNLSVFDRENGHMAITPSGIDFFEIKPEDIVRATRWRASAPVPLNGKCICCNIRPDRI